MDEAGGALELLDGVGMEERGGEMMMMMTANEPARTPVDGGGGLHQIRRYGEKVGDYQMVDGWWGERGRGQFLENLLPPDGYIVERDGEAVAVLWLYFSYGIGVAFMEFAVSRPGQSAGQSKAAFRHLLNFARMEAKSRDFGVIWAHTFPSVAEFLKEEGFHVFPSELKSVITSTEQFYGT